LSRFTALLVALGVLTMQASASFGIELSESRDKAPRQIRVNFELAGSRTPCGWKADTGRVYGERGELRFGWNFDHSDVTRDRDKVRDQLFDTLSHFHADGVWEIAVDDGPHTVHIGIGDAEYSSTHFLNIEGSPVWWNQHLEAGSFDEVRKTVYVRDGRLTLDQGGAPEKATRIDFIEIDVPKGSNPPCDRDEPKPTPSQPPAPEPGDTSGGSGGLGPRPYGLKGLKRTFGKRCSSKANDARTYFPSAGGRGDAGYVYYHSKLARKVGNKIARSLKRHHRGGAVDYGVWGYACRMKTGGTSWSVHSWGAAIDTNTLRNPYGARSWNGKGSNGKKYGRYYPELWMNNGFYWGLNFADPMHFQYVSGY
jgi:hypothetical protein